jgi:hypothetical protein
MKAMRFIFTTAALMGTIALAAPASAQGTGTARADARWSAWLGCWTPADAATRLTGTPGGRIVCVVPAAGTSAVDIVTIAARQIVSREHLEATGAERKAERDGCTGWERARWSQDGRRIYLRSEFICADGAKRASSGLMAMSVTGEWLNVAGVTMGGNTGTRVLRHQAVDVTTNVPQDVASALPGTTRASAAARVAVASAVANAEIIEASHELDAAVVEAWLSEAGQAFTANEKRLVALADAGVPDRVIDVVVALSYPRAFAIKPSVNVAGELATGGSRTSGSSGEFSSLDAVSSCAPYAVAGPGAYRGFSMYGWDNCAMYYGYSPYAYSRYGNVPYGTWYLNSQPVVILLTPNLGAGADTHGQVTKGRGYVEGGNNGGTATNTSSSGNSAGSSAGSSGSSSGGAGGASTSGSGSSSGDRTAHPK